MSQGIYKVQIKVEASELIEAMEHAATNTRHQLEASMVSEVWIHKKLHPWYVRLWHRVQCFFKGHETQVFSWKTMTVGPCPRCGRK
jgi:hypothetical protein